MKSQLVPLTRSRESTKICRILYFKMKFTYEQLRHLADLGNAPGALQIKNRKGKVINPVKGKQPLSVFVIGAPKRGMLRAQPFQGKKSTVCFRSRHRR